MVEHDVSPEGAPARGRQVARPRVRDVVADGLYVAAAATRLTLKNRLLVASVAHDETFDVGAWIPEAQAVVRELADEAEAEADRVAVQLRGLWRKFDESTGTHEYRSRDTRNLRRRRKQSLHIAKELRSRADDREAMTKIVIAARDAAWEELAANIHIALRAEAARPDRDANYQQMRAARMQALRLVDLPKLRAQRRAREQQDEVRAAADARDDSPASGVVG
ncbi:asparagine synthase [uncultured Microbacterium sp.]|uniref:asparagine synthase n=1 Tax=uncultured Microbacterium sp. TaxID=191216 RepID=UPI0025DE4296|nr:asparagine synthase [uncultured Microbacterium sp.]